MESSSAAERPYDRLYREGGFGYERTRLEWEAWVERHYIHEFGLMPGETVLDIPCGDGFWSSVLHGAGFAVTGADMSAGGIEVARAKYPGIPFVVGDAEGDLPFPDGHFDVVFSRGISHFHRRELFTDSTARMIPNLLRYVRKGGILLISYHTRRDGSGTDTHFHHSLADLIKVIEPHGDIFKVDVVNDFVQVGVQHPNHPGRRPTRLWDPSRGMRMRLLARAARRRSAAVLARASGRRSSR